MPASPAAKIKVIVVDDSSVIRGLFSEILASAPDIEVIATAEDPFDAREKIKRFNPDVITLDVEMPKMDGLTFLERIMKLRPMPVIMASSLTTRGADITIRALEMGAVDYIAKPKMLEEGSACTLGNTLIEKVRHAARVQVRGHVAAAPRVLAHGGARTRALLAIGASTGGVEALRDILAQMPANSPPIVITQHMPELFTASFARRMDQLSALQVYEARHGQPIVPGCAYIAPGSDHLEVIQKGDVLYCQLSGGALVSGHKPSVDKLFDSVSRILGYQLVGAILTGMGRDGAQGLLAMRRAGARTFGQSEGSCVVYGMPKAAMSLGAVEHELPLAELPQALLQCCNPREAKP